MEKRQYFFMRCMRLVLLAGFIASSMSLFIPFQARAAEDDTVSLTAKAEAGDAAAQYALGKRYEDEGNLVQAAFLFSEAALQAHADAQYSLGNYNYHGYGLDQNREQALELWRKAAEQGHVFAQSTLGDLYSTGELVMQDYFTAAAWYSKAAEQGHMEAQQTLGEYYAVGLGVQQSSEQAVLWYTKAAEQGALLAQYRLGYAYETGVGVAQDYEKAAEWYGLAAMMGHPLSLMSMGTFYHHGRGGLPVDHDRAVACFRDALRQGYGGAAYALGKAYLQGAGVERDVLQGYTYLLLANSLNFVNDDLTRLQDILRVQLSVAAQAAAAQQVVVLLSGIERGD